MNRKHLYRALACCLAALLLLLSAACDAIVNVPKETAPPAAAEETSAPAETSVPVETSAPAPTAVQTEPAGVPFGSFASVDLDGNEVTESVFSEAKLTMVNVWGTFCSPCINEMPGLGALAAEYEDKGVQIVGIVIDVSDQDDPLLATAKRIVEDTGADYLHLLPSDALWKAKLNGVSAIPTTFFIDASGNVISEDYIGSNSEDGWRKVIDGALLLVP